LSSAAKSLGEEEQNRVNLSTGTAGAIL